MERVDVYRGQAVTDADGNTVQGPLELIASFNGLVAPDNVSETASVDSQGVTWDHTIYIRSDKPTGILDTDLIGVRNRRLPVDGTVQSWDRVDGTHVGDVIHVRLKEG